MPREKISVDGDSRAYWPVFDTYGGGMDSPDWMDAETCPCESLSMDRGKCVCPECGTVYAVVERRAVKRWKTIANWTL